MRLSFLILVFSVTLAVAQDSTKASLSYGETFVVSQFFANARVAVNNNAKAQIDTVAAVAALQEKLTRVLSDTTRKLVLSVNAFEKYFISRMLNQKGLQIPATWAGTLLRIREKLGTAQPLAAVKK